MKTNFTNFVSKFNRRSGFSLVELMIVVAIIGILAALAIPRFQQFQSKSRQAEARGNLAHIYTLQVSYNGDNDTFSGAAQTAGCLTIGGGSTKTCTIRTAASWDTYNTCNTTNDIGFRITDCKKVRYTYSQSSLQNQFTTTASEMDAGTSANRRVFPGCSGTNDVWQINENKELYNQNLPTALQSCAN